MAEHRGLRNAKNLFIHSCGVTRDAKARVFPSRPPSENNIVSQPGNHYVSARARDRVI